MKKILPKTKSLATLILTIMLVATLPLTLLIPTAYAAAAIALTPTSGPCGTVVLVTGTGYTADLAALTLTFGGLTTAWTAGGGTTSTGALTTGSTFTVPSTTSGTYTVVVSDAAGDTASASFTITAVTLKISPTSGPTGNTILVSATGFLPLAAVTGTFGAVSVTLDPSTADDDGYLYTRFTSAELNIPTTYPSSKSVVLTDASGNRGTATYSLTAPSITLSPTSGTNTRTVTVTGSGFKAGGTITIKWDASQQTLEPSTTVASSTGTFTAKFAITSSVDAEKLVGAHTVYAYDGTSAKTNVASATFTVTPSITVYMGATTTSSTTNYVPKGQTGSIIIVTGKGFAASSALTFTFAGPVTPINTFATTTSDAAGALSITSSAATWPNTAGTYSLTITDAQSNYATATIVANADGSFWSLGSTSGPVGTSVTATYFGATSSGNLEASTGASAEWVTDPLYPYANTNVAKLYQLGDTAGKYAYVKVYPTTALTLNSMATASNIPTFKYYMGVSCFQPALELRFSETGGTGYVDVTVFAYGPVTPVWPTTTGIWHDTASYALTTGHYAVAYGLEADATPIAISLGNNPLSAIISQIVVLDATAGTWVLTRVTPQVGWQAVGPQTVYIDAVTIDSVLYPLEPSDIKVGATSTGLAVGPTANVYPTPSSQAFTVPNLLPGVYTVTGTNGFSTMEAATFTVTTASPTMTLSPTSGPKLGGPVTITASGFISGASITYTFAGTTLATTDTSVVSGAVIATFNVPSYILGAHTVTLSDGTNTASATFTITAPSVTLVSSTIKSKTTMIKANFTNFDQSAVISTFTIGGVSVTAQVPTSTDAAGKAYCTFTSPNTVTGGSQTLIVTDASGNTYSQTVTAVPKITLTPNAGVVGTEVTLTGWGFGALKTATMTMGTTSVTLYTGTTAGVTTLVDGKIPTSSAVTFTIPSTLTTGPYTVTVTDTAANTATATFTLGAPEFTMTPSTGSAGTIVTVTGTGWIPDITNLGWIKFDTTTVYTNGDTDSDGKLNPLAGWTFTVPAVAAGSHTVTVSDGTHEKTATFTVIAPSITLSATSSNVADTITITGSGFNPAQTIAAANVYFGASAVGALATTNTVTAVASDGTLGTGVKIAVPAGSVAGNYTIKLKFTSPNLEASQTFTVTPKITVSPTTGVLRGTIITVTGTGFAASKDITVTIAGTTKALSVTATSTTGTISGTYTMPIDQTTGASILIVTDAAGNSAQRTITVGVPTVTLSPSSGATGTTVQVTGTGFFPALVTYIIAFDGVVQTTSPSALTSSTGSAIGFFTVPTTAATGTHTVALTDTNGNTASATFTVTTVAAAAVDSATLSSTAGTVNPTTGTTQTSFARGTSVKNTFVLKTTTGTANVIWKITFQQPDLSVYNIVTTSASVSTTPSTISMEQLLPSTAQTGTWTATVQIFASDGVTPLAVTTVTFAVTAS